MPGLSATQLIVDELNDVIRHERVRSLYQPIVEIESGEVVAYEALARGPAGSNLETPDALFGAAAASGRTRELDWECQRAALSGALHAELGRDTRLFVNVEPSALDEERPPAIAAAFARAEETLGVVLEVSERAVLKRPKELLDLVTRARAHGWGIALDDVGVNPESLSLMPFIDPDVIKLDISVVQEPPTPETGRLLNAVFAQSERSGAVILAEGIETEQHATLARALGATLGQGWRYGRPAPLLASNAIGGARIAVDRVPAIVVPDTPFDLVASSGRTRVATKELLIAISHDLENQALRSSGDGPVVLGAFQTAPRFTAATHARYAKLASACVFVGAVGIGLGVMPAPGVRGGSLSLADRLAGEWTVTVLTPHHASALIARDLGDGGPDRQRRFEYAITHDRALVALAARSLLYRIVATA
jgi:EAL domain-containing protein (putative c-di-GMP-specific phosphodiesterase class I)